MDTQCAWQLLNCQDLIRVLDKLDVSLCDSMWKRLTDPPLTVLQFQGTALASTLQKPSDPSRKLEIIITKKTLTLSDFPGAG